jgi:uncharacterized membrane protein YhhN
MSVWLMGLCALFVLGTVLSEKAAHSLGAALCKPAASACFLGVGWLEGRDNPLLLVGLLFGAVGDVALLARTAKTPFLIGMISFLAGHIAYVGLLLQGEVALWPIGLAGLGLLFSLRPLFGWLSPGVPSRLRLPVAAYVLTILTMVAVAVGRGLRDSPGLLAAALLFAVSDLFVARNRFVQNDWKNRAIGLPLYYTAQMMFASLGGLSGS